MKLLVDEVDYTEYPDEINPELIDERILAMLKPSVPSLIDRHQVVYYNGVGFII